MVWQKEVLGYTYSGIAANLNVDKATVIRTLQLFNNTGQVSKKAYCTSETSRILTPAAQYFVLNLVVSKPGLYLWEIQNELKDLLMLDVSLSTICKFLHKSSFTRQRLRLVALQQDQYLKEKFIIDVSLYSSNMSVFIDETGADKRNTLRKYSYSLCGKPATQQSLLVRGERVSAIACMTVEGILDVKTHKETSTGDIFYDFIQSHLIPHLCPFDGFSSNSVVVLDNCSIHHCEEVVTSLRDVGVMIHFLPHYSPDLNLIEEAFSKVKSQLQSVETLDDTEAAVLASFATISVQDCRN